MHGPRKFCQRGPTLTLFAVIVFVLVDDGREDPNTISGPARKSPLISLFAGVSISKLLFAGVSMMAQH